MMLEVKVLTDKNSPYLEQIANWQYECWGQKHGDTKEFLRKTFENSICGNRIPQIIIATENGELRGYCWINMFDDLLEYPNIYPWLANLYIDKPHRGKGIARRILDYIPTAMKNLGITELFLNTDHPNLYEKFGWEFIADITPSKPYYTAAVKLYRLRLEAHKFT
jgi:GNAT superfamily N-acetyltransferase